VLSTLALCETIYSVQFVTFGNWSKSSFIWF